MSEPMVSYALNHEDVLLHRVFRDRPVGFYIDAGAFDPVDHSVTKHFYDRGWRGINIEPDSEVFGRLRADRVRDVNLNVGVSDRVGEQTLFGGPGAHWSADLSLVTGYFRVDPRDVVRVTVRVTTLAQICERHVPPGQTIDFLKVDVEGLEGAVIAGADWARWRPRVVLVEVNHPETWEPRLLGSGYLFAAFDGVNRYYVRSEDADLLPAFDAPVNVSDNYVIYNYIRAINELQDKLQDLAGLGPVSLGVARRLRALSARHPRLARLAKRVIRRVA